MKEKDVENLKLRLKNEYELKMKELERIHYERLQLTKQETRRAFDVTMENMKTIYEDEIKQLKGNKRELEDRINQLKREVIKKEGDL